MEQSGVAVERAMLKAALVRLQRCASSVDLREAVSEQTAEDLERGVSAVVEAIEVASFKESAVPGERIDAVCADVVCVIAGRCVALFDEADVTELSVAEAVREGLMCLAALLMFQGVPAHTGGEAVDPWQQPLASRALKTLEGLSMHLDVLVAQLFVSLSRIEDAIACVGGAGVTSTPLQLVVQEMSKHYFAVQGVAVWSLTLLARAIGYGRLTCSVLWEWASADAFCIMVLAKGLLAYGQGGNLDLQLHENTGTLPSDLPEVRDAVLAAIMGLASPDVAFGAELVAGSDAGSGGSGDTAAVAAMGGEDRGAVGIEERTRVLSLHRAKLSAAVVDCDIANALVTYLAEPSSSYRAVSSPGAVPPHLAVAAFFAALLPPPPDGVRLEVRLSCPARSLAETLARRVDELWRSLGSVPTCLAGFRDHVRAVAFGRQFLRDCATIAYVVPPPPESCQEFLAMLLPELPEGACSGWSEGVPPCRSDARSLAALTVLAANACISTEQGDVLAGALLRLPLEVRAEVGSRLSKWRGLVRADMLVPWVELINAVLQDPVASDGEEDGFFHLNRQPVPPPPSVMSELAGTIPPAHHHAQAHLHAAAPHLGLACARQRGGGLRDTMREVPYDLRCAMDGKLVVDPVRTPQGLVFERSVLQRALASMEPMPRCPVTGEMLTMDQCERAADVRLKSLQWVRAAHSRPWTADEDDAG